MRNRRRQNVTRLGLQYLEDRTALAGDMRIFEAGGNLFIFGDSAANEISLVRSGFGDITISSLDATTELNGQTGDLTFAGINRGIFIHTRGGDDVVQISSEFSDSSSGPADDDVFKVGRGLHIHTGDGNDEIQLSDVKVGRNLILLTGRGDDLISAPSHALTAPITENDGGVTVGGVTVMVTGSGADRVSLANSEFNKLFVLNALKGDDQVLVQDSEFDRTSVFVGGSGTDSLSRTTNTFARTPHVHSFENQGDAIAPTAVNDTETVDEGEANVEIDVAANDFDPDGNLAPNTIVITTPPTNGTATPNPDGTVTYTHDGTDTTSDLFLYTIKDSSGKTSNIATVNITVTPV